MPSHSTEHRSSKPLEGRESVPREVRSLCSTVEATDPDSPPKVLNGQSTAQEPPEGPPEISPATAAQTRSEAAERFWSKVDRNTGTGCFEWKRAKSRDGYGRFSFGGRGQYVYAHRFAYELVVGPIPAGMHLDHLCRNTSCVNPTHLEPVTPRVNVLRGAGFPAAKAAQTHCVRGHEFSLENTIARSRAQGGRACKECRREYDRRRRPRDAERQSARAQRSIERRVRSIKHEARKRAVVELKANLLAARAAGMSFRRLGERFGISTMYAYRLWRSALTSEVAP